VRWNAWRVTSKVEKKRGVAIAVVDVDTKESYGGDRISRACLDAGPRGMWRVSGCSARCWRTTPQLWQWEKSCQASFKRQLRHTPPCSSNEMHDDSESAQVPVSPKLLRVLFTLVLEHRVSLYSGHRRESFICADVDELVELRASQRTYNGAYVRTALGTLGYSLTVLRLFDRQFYRRMSLFLSCFIPFSPHAFDMISGDIVCRSCLPLVYVRIPPCTPFAPRPCRPG
jgi:hypothetical protein